MPKKLISDKRLDLILGVIVKSPNRYINIRHMCATKTQTGIYIEKVTHLLALMGIPFKMVGNQ